MYTLTNDETRALRKMDRGTLTNLYERCNHSSVGSIPYNNTKLMICQRCARSWYASDPVPPRGNPKLARFLKPCEHTHIRTLPGTTTHNQCLECDKVLQKSDAASVWKSIKNTFENIAPGSPKNNNSPKSIKFVWDPDVYGDKMWGVEYY